MTKKRLDELIARMEPRIAKRFRAVMARVKSRRTLAQIEAAIDSGATGQAISTVLDDIEAAAASVAGQTAAVQALVGGEVADYLATKLDKLVSFDGSNPRVVAAAARNRYELIQGLVEEQRQAIGEALRIGHELGLNPRQTAIAIRDSIGLTVEQTQWVANYRRALERGSRKALAYELRDARADRAVEGAIKAGKPLSPERIDKLVDRYAERALKYRSEVIARTEAHRNANEAHDEAYEQTIENGHVDAERIQQKWLKGARPRPWHNSMHGQLRKWRSPFRSGQGNPLKRPGDRDAPASETAQCNCGRAVRVLPPGQVAVDADAVDVKQAA